MEEFSNEEKFVDATSIAKGKRTKRLRFLSSCGVASTLMTSSCSSDDENEYFDDLEEEDDEDMANCLILLAQGGSYQKQHSGGGDDGNDNNIAEKGSNGKKKIALGGHRASHKKLKIMAEEKRASLQLPEPRSYLSHDSQPIKLVAKSDEFEEGKEPRGGPTISSLQMGNHGLKAFYGNKHKIHECSICGSEFTSGQALGGHMRRHRTSSANASIIVDNDGGVRPRNILQLDLNLPAPEDDLRETKFQFQTKNTSMVMSASPTLVGCHY
ncbi:zinc finger protein ZAT5 [Cicer arietinum]|uniref:Zinc finger protein ZAT5 n=1 Tax=Cicer arietinum TaxID=3827 RepID=A0A1S2YKB1_CICAR|nr:zinc finger protein ZAT5 [Cicer arietinum]